MTLMQRILQVLQAQIRISGNHDLPPEGKQKAARVLTRAA